MKKKSDWKRVLLISILTLAVGSIPAMFTDMKGFKKIVKPPLSPPGLIFPIVWTTLFVLMSISLALVTSDDDPDNRKYYTIYIMQLIVNSLWTLIFFRFKLYLFGFIWIIFLLTLVIIMIYMFGKKNKLSAYLLLPYALWLGFVAYLNLGIYLLN